MSRKIAVIAGTSVDTAMGADYLRIHAPEYESISYPVSQTPQEQTLFQNCDTRSKEQKMGEILTDAKSKGVETVFVYCNSLSGSVDFPKLARLYTLNIITPLIAYAQLGRRYQRLGVLAANNQSLAGIEHATLSGNPDVEVIGVSLLPVVKQIEEKKSPQDIVSAWQLPSLMRFFEQTGAQAVVLGCTHFPYLAQALSAYSYLPIIDPADDMLHMLKEFGGVR